MYGRLSDIWSRKIILLTGLAIFFVGSLASSLAQSVLQLAIFRAFTGIGGGGLMTVAQLIVSDVVPLRERGKYQGILVSRGNIAFSEQELMMASVLGCCSGHRQRRRSRHRWRALLAVWRFVALDLPHAAAADALHHLLRLVFYAPEEG